MLKVNEIIAKIKIEVCILCGDILLIFRVHLNHFFVYILPRQSKVFMNYLDNFFLYEFENLKDGATTVGGGLLNLSVTGHSFQEQKH